MTERTLPQQLGEAARNERDELIKFNLGLIADELNSAIKKFSDHPSADNLIAVNSHWAHGIRMLDFASTRGGGGSTGAGLKEGALLQKVV